MCIRDSFKAAEKRISDVADGFAESDAVNLQQLNDVRRYVKSEMYKVCLLYTSRCV